MAATPPAQIHFATPDTPPTPLHGARYDEDSPRRFSARLKQKASAQSQGNGDGTKTPDQSPRKPVSQSTFALSPGRTPKRKYTEQVQVFSPPSPDFDHSTRHPARSQRNHLQPYLSSTTTMSEAMLPTPVKTPKKQQVSKPSLAARALFQDEMAPSPKKSRKAKRFNGFSLESFRADNTDGQVGVQIYTDSRDVVPETDGAAENPFLDEERRGTAGRRVSRSSKRRKVSTEKPMDPQVEEAIQNDEGMVYVFRGRKVYRRFDDTGEEEEEIDAEDLGLLRHVADGIPANKQLRTLTRKSIKPTRLFQTEQQKRDREIEREEEAATDIEEVAPTEPETSKSEPQAISNGPPNQTSEPTSDNDTQAVGKHAEPKVKKGSPFDAWQRLKGPTAMQKSMRSRKRAAPQDFDIHET